MSSTLCQSAHSSIKKFYVCMEAWVLNSIVSNRFLSWWDPWKYLTKDFFAIFSGQIQRKECLVGPKTKGESVLSSAVTSWGLFWKNMTLTWCAELIRWSRRDTSSLRRGSWWQFSVLPTTVGNFRIRVLWWAWMSLWCVHFKSLNLQRRRNETDLKYHIIPILSDSHLWVFLIL